MLNNRTGGMVMFFMAVALSALSAIFPHSSEGAEYRIQPGIMLGEEYNDNVFLQPENEKADFVSRVAPSLDLLYQVPLWDWKVRGFYEYRYYHQYHNFIKDNDNIAYLDLANHTRLKDQYIYLDVKDNYSRVSLSSTRDFTQESAFINQTDRNLFTVNPYSIVRPTSRMTVTTGYSYSNTWYKDPTANDQLNHSVYTGFQQDLSLRTVMSAGIRHTQYKIIPGAGSVVTGPTTTVRDYTQDDVYVGYRYEYIENSTLYLSIGNTWFQVKNTDRISQVTWDASLTHRYSTMTVIYETGLRFIPDPYGISRRQDRYLATLSRDVERTSIAASGGLIQYRNIRSKHLEDSNYLVHGTVSHAVTTKSRFIFDIGMDWYKDYIAYTKTYRYRGGVRFEHLAAETLTLALDYRYTNLYSPDTYLNNYSNNRVSVELRKVF